MAKNKKGVDNRKGARNRKDAMDNWIFYFAVAFLIFAAIIFFFNLAKIAKITGKASSTGTANLTIESRAQVNFTTNFINWGSGSVTPGQQNATLNTAGGASSVLNGNWTANTAGFVLKNIGNQNVSVDLMAGKTAAAFVGGASPSYQFNVTNSTSCINTTTFTHGVFYDVNTTSPGTRVCSDFHYNDSADTIRVDIKLVVPSDANKTGAATDTITATATALL